MAHASDFYKNILSRFLEDTMQHALMRSQDVSTAS
jgi:hypothetical protein